jgi:hypothetical protein
MSEEEIEVRISISPSPPSESMPMTVCYDFSGLLVNDVTISIEFATTPTTGLSVKPTKDDPCVEVAVPKYAGAVLLEDMSGRSGDVTSIVGP